MPFISSETVKEIRKEIKAEFKAQGMKFSVTMDGHSTVNVALLEAKIDFNGNDTVNVNNYYIESSLKEYPEAVVLFQRVVEIINKHQEQKESSYDADYGSIPTFYIDLEVGKWNKAYKQVA